MAMELRALFLLPLFFPGLQSQTPEAQRRREGGTLYVQCPYTAQTSDWSTKFWCLSRDEGCQELLRAYRTSSTNGRITIEDDTTARTVSVTMTALKAEDSGTYFCAYYSSRYVPLRMFSLNVFKELLKWELDTLSVQCPPSPWRSSMTWCRREGETRCTDPLGTQTPATRSRGSRSQQDRAWIKYEVQQRVLNVTMKKLQTRDTGVYWCALNSGSTRVMEVMLSVFKRTQQLRAKESGNISVQCHYKVADYKDVSKAWCKEGEGEKCNVLVTTSSEPPEEQSTAREGVTIQDDTKQGIVTITMEQLQLQDSGVYWCALQERSDLSRMEEVTLSVSKVLPRGRFSDTERKSEEILLGNSPEPSSDGNTFLVLSVVLLILFLLALVASVTLGVRHYKLLGRAGNREAEDTGDRAEGTAQPGSTGRRESSQDASKGPAYINLDMQSQPSPEDPLYCNVEPSQAHRNAQDVDYAVIAFNQTPRNGRE